MTVSDLIKNWISLVNPAEDCLRSGDDIHSSEGDVHGQEVVLVVVVRGHQVEGARQGHLAILSCPSPLSRVLTRGGCQGVDQAGKY